MINDDNWPFLPAQAGTLTLFTEQTNDFSHWAFNPRHNRPLYPVMVAPGDALIIFDPSVQNPLMPEHLFRALLTGGRDVPLDERLSDNILYSTNALVLDFDINKVDMSLETDRQDKMTEDLKRAGYPAEFAKQISTYAPGTMMQYIHDVLVQGLPEDMPPQDWLQAYERGYPAMLAKAKPV